MSEFKVGDVVQLKSGGPFMTAVSIGDNRVTCFWFNKKDEAQEAYFYPKVLKNLSKGSLADQRARAGVKWEARKDH